MNAIVLPSRHVPRLLTGLAIVGALSFAAGTTSAQENVGSATTKPAAKPSRPPIYDTKADARALVDAATARARREGTRVLVMFGFNECPWCHKLHTLITPVGSKPISQLVRNAYELVMVDIGATHADELLKQCKAALAPEELAKGVGYPFLAVLDGAGKVVTAQRTDPLEVGDHHDPAKVQAFLEKWTAAPRDAEQVVADALAKAASADKSIFLHFGAPWCGWCHKLDDFLAEKTITDILGREFIEVKVDVDRMKNGKEVMERYTHGKQGGIPWFVILDTAGKPLATSDGPKGNIGYPAQPEEINHFLGMLKQTARRIDPAQIAQIRSRLEAKAAELKPQH